MWNKAINYRNRIHLSATVLRHLGRCDGNCFTGHLRRNVYSSGRTDRTIFIYFLRDRLYDLFAASNVSGRARIVIVSKRYEKKTRLNKTRTVSHSNNVARCRTVTYSGRNNFEDPTEFDYAHLVRIT